MPTVQMEPPETDRVPETTEVTGSNKRDKEDGMINPPPKFDPEPQQTYPIFATLGKGKLKISFYVSNPNNEPAAVTKDVDKDCQKY